MQNIKLKYLYYKTKLHQKFYKDGTFPFKYYFKLTYYVNKYNIKESLECGTAIGLTAIAILLGNKNVKLDTIEKQNRNLLKAKNNILSFDKNNILKFKNRFSAVEGRYFDILETGELKDKIYDLIFLDAYISRYNEVYFLSKKLKKGGIFIVSNLREHVPKSVLAKNFLLNLDENGENLKDKEFEFLEMLEDTIFVKKIK